MVVIKLSKVSEKQLLKKFSTLRQHTQGGKRASHKPLLLLYALANVQRAGDRLHRFDSLLEPITSLLDEFGRPIRAGGQQTVRDPFWRLEGDGQFWEVPQRQKILLERTNPARRDLSINKGELLHAAATGGFRQDVYDFLLQHPDTIHKLAAVLLDTHFAPSLHPSILDAVGMQWTLISSPKRRTRDPNFRHEILRIYQGRCCACGYDGRLGSRAVGIEAAHIRWHSADGPDHPTNGLALCALHHTAFDSGAFCVTDKRVIAVSQHYVESSSTSVQSLTSLHGRRLPTPISGAGDSAALTYIHWHQTEVFRAPARAS